MPSFNFEHERARIAELQQIGMHHGDIVQSVEKNVRNNLLERTGALSPFDLEITGKKVSQLGYEHRGDGDLDASYELSEKAATESYIEKRYRLENEGYGAAKEHFFDLPLGSTILLMSPPPDEPIPGYPGHSMSYFYHILPHPSGDEKKRTIKALSWVNYFKREEQAELLNDLGAKEEVAATEASILQNPVFAAAEGLNTLSFQALWAKMGEQYAKQGRPDAFRFPPVELAERLLLEGDTLWEKYHGHLALMTTDLSQRLVNGESDDEIARDWDIMLNLADQELMHVDITQQLSVMKEDWDASVIPGRVVFDAHRALAYPPRVIATLCGESAGLGRYDTLGSMFTTATFTVENTSGPVYSGENAKDDPNLCKTCPGEKPHFHCGGSEGSCTQRIIVGEGTTSCPACGKGKTC